MRFKMAFNQIENDKSSITVMKLRAYWHELMNSLFKACVFIAAQRWKESSKFILFQQVFFVNLCGVTRAAVQLSYQQMSVGEFVNYVLYIFGGVSFGKFYVPRFLHQ